MLQKSDKALLDLVIKGYAGICWPRLPPQHHKGP